MNIKKLLLGLTIFALSGCFSLNETSTSSQLTTIDETTVSVESSETSIISSNQEEEEGTMHLVPIFSLTFAEMRLYNSTTTQVYDSFLYEVVYPSSPVNGYEIVILNYLPNLSDSSKFGAQQKINNGPMYGGFFVSAPINTLLLCEGKDEEEITKTFFRPSIVTETMNTGLFSYNPDFNVTGYTFFSFSSTDILITRVTVYLIPEMA